MSNIYLYIYSRYTKCIFLLPSAKKQLISQLIPLMSKFWPIYLSKNKKYSSPTPELLKHFKASRSYES
jgi:hypothetical protein